MLDDVLELLQCPVCQADLARSGRVLRCAGGHSFDIARQGYVSLVAGPAGDSAEMVAARLAFLEGGHLEPLVARLAERCADLAPTGDGAVLELGAGAGHQLARVLDLLPNRAGLALDSSKPALRRAARAHPRIGAVGCDAWSALPVRTGVAALALSVFAPRNGPELARVVEPTGRLVVVTPGPDHLAELVERLGLLSVDERKQERLAETLGPHFAEEGEEWLNFALRLSRADAEAAVAMGPSARHVSADRLREALAAMAEPLAVTASVRISVRRLAPHLRAVWPIFGDMVAVFGHPPGRQDAPAA